MTPGRARRAVETTMNGDVNSVDPAVRRAVLTLADHIDDLSGDVVKLNKTVLTVGMGIITSLIAAAIGTLL